MKDIEPVFFRLFINELIETFADTFNTDFFRCNCMEYPTSYRLSVFDVKHHIIFRFTIYFTGSIVALYPDGGRSFIIERSRNSEYRKKIFRYILIYEYGRKEKKNEKFVL